MLGLGSLVWLGLAVRDLHDRGFAFGGVNLDGIAYRYQVQTFARGRLANPSTQPLGFFETWGIVDDGQRAYSKYFPGHALLMGPFYWVSGDWGFTAGALALMSALAVAAVAGVLGGRSAAVVALLLLGISPFFLMTSATGLSHNSCLAFQAVATLGLIMSRRKQSLAGVGLWAGLGGLGSGMALMTRPLTALAVLLPGGSLLLWDALKRRPQARQRLIVAAGVLGLCVMAQMAYNERLTGDAWKTPFSVYWPPDRIGFGPWRGQGPAVGQWVGPYVEAHTPARAMKILGSNLSMLDRWLLGGQGSLAAVMLLIFWRMRRSGVDVERGLLLAILLLQPLLYGLLWFEGLNHTGPIYWFEMLLPLAVLGGWSLAGWLSDKRQWGLVLLGTLALAGLGWQLRVRPALAPLETVTRLQKRDLQTLQQRIQPPAIVFLPETHLGKPLSSLLNGPDPLAQPILYALDRGAENHRLTELYPDRRAWRVLLLPGDPRPIGWRLELVPLDPGSPSATP